MDFILATGVFWNIFFSLPSTSQHTHLLCSACLQWILVYDSLIIHNLRSASFSTRMKHIQARISAPKTKHFSLLCCCESTQDQGCSLLSLAPANSASRRDRVSQLSSADDPFLSNSHHNTMNGTQDPYNPQTHPIETHSIQMRHLILRHQAAPHPTPLR